MSYQFERGGFKAMRTIHGLQRITIHWFRQPNKDLLEARPMPHLIAVVNTKSNHWIANNTITKQSHNGRAERAEDAKSIALKYLVTIG